MATCSHGLDTRRCLICKTRAAERRRTTADEFNAMLDNCIKHLADDASMDRGVEELREIASWCKTAGFTKKRWLDLCAYIEGEAARRSSSELILEKIKLAIRRSTKIAVIGTHQ